MVFTSTKLALNKRTLSRKSVSTRRNEAFDKKSQPEKTLEIKNTEENQFTPNFKNYIHQKKKALNKSTKFVIDRKSIPTSQNEGFLEKCDFTGPKNYFHSNQYLKKQIEENGFLQQK